MQPPTNQVSFLIRHQRRTWSASRCEKATCPADHVPFEDANSQLFFLIFMNSRLLICQTSRCWKERIFRYIFRYRSTTISSVGHLVVGHARHQTTVTRDSDVRYTDVSSAIDRSTCLSLTHLFQHTSSSDDVRVRHAFFLSGTRTSST